jgi:hypothetical protein
MTAVAAAQTDSTEAGRPPGDSPPSTIIELVKNAGEASKYDSASYVVVLDESVNRVSDLGVTFSDLHLVYKVLTEDGCKELATFRQGYEPLSSFVQLKEVNLIRGDSVLPVTLDDVVDLPAPQSGIYWGDRIIMVQLPRLKVGDGVEVKYYRKGYSYALLRDEEPDDERYVPPMPGQYFDIVLFEGRAPILEKRYVLKLPADKRLHSQVYNGPVYSKTSYDPDTTIYSWWTKDIPAWKPEPFRPSASDFLTKVVLATVETWEAKSRWFFEVNEGQFEVTEAISAKVEEILAEAGVSNGTAEEKAFELVHWVAQNIRYSGQTMGEGEGFTLHSGAMIFEQRSGVCKDIAGMLVTMMRAAGLDSYAAMTMAGSRIEVTPADQFNHCVVALKTPGGKYVMYDPTWVPFSRARWSLLETEQHYLIGSPEGEGLDQIRYSPPEESPLNIRNTCTLDANGSLAGTMELTADGAMDGYLRRIVSWFSLEEREDYFLRMLAKIGDGIILDRYEHGDILDFHQQMWWRIDYRVPNYALVTDSALEFKSPMMQFTKDNRIMFRAGSREWPEKRHDDLFLYYTQYLNGSETVKLPKDYSIDEPPKSEKIDTTYAFFSGTSKMAGSELSVSQQAKLRRRQIPPESYGGFRKAMNEAREFAETVFRASKGGKKCSRVR